MQRSSVDLPEPLRPIRATTVARSTEKDTSFSTASEPKLLCTRDKRTTDMEPPFKPPAECREGKADEEVERRDAAEDGQRLEGQVVDQLAGPGELDEADEGGQRRILDDLHHDADGRRGRHADGLRNDDVPKLLYATEAERGRTLPLRARHGLDAAAPYLAEEGARIERQRQGGGGDRRQVGADEAEPEIPDEELDQQRRALDDLNVDPGQRPYRPRPRDTAERHEPTDEAAADEGDDREQHRPLRRLQKEEGVVPDEVPDAHSVSSSGRAAAGAGRRPAPAP